MAVLKAKPERIVAFFLGMMQRELVLPNLVTPIAEENFVGALGDTVNLRIKGAMAVARDYEWRTRTAPIQYDDIAEREDSIPVVLDTHTYSATKITDEQFKLDEIEFASDVLAEQVTAVVNRLHSRVTTGLRAANFKESLVFTPESDPLKVGAEAKRLLSKSKVAPLNGRFFLVSSDIASHWEVSRRMTDYSLSGPAANTMFGESIVGRLKGVPVVVSDLLLPNEGYLLHRSWAAMANVAPRVPASVKNGAITRRGGYAVRWMTHYVPDYLSDASIVSTFHGLSSIRDERKLTGQFAGDLLDEADPNRGLFNVRGIKLAPTGFDSAIDLDYDAVRTIDVTPAAG